MKKLCTLNIPLHYAINIYLLLVNTLESRVLTDASAIVVQHTYSVRSYFTAVYLDFLSILRDYYIVNILFHKISSEYSVRSYIYVCACVPHDKRTSSRL